MIASPLNQTPLESLVMGGVSKILSTLVTYPTQVRLLMVWQPALEMYICAALCLEGGIVQYERVRVLTQRTQHDSFARVGEKRRVSSLLPAGTSSTEVGVVRGVFPVKYAFNPRERWPKVDDWVRTRPRPFPPGIAELEK